MLDVIYLAATFALFALVGLIAKAVENFGPRAGGSTLHEVMSGGEQG